ncbi:hypothetical protein N7451_004347 [Penicillium sp. IBT 35674x]|nr:hypothetical protein N7451_004347 [Penicillium sp. IBT 35674x]
MVFTTNGYKSAITPELHDPWRAHSTSPMITACSGTNMPARKIQRLVCLSSIFSLNIEHTEISTTVNSAMNAVDPPLTKNEFETAFYFRKRVRETERACARMTVENYNATIDPYRATTLQPAWPHPLKLLFDPNLVRDIDMESDIAKQLWIGGLHNQGLVTVAIVSAERYSNQLPQKLLTIRFLGQIVRPDALNPVMLKMQKTLDNIGCEDAHVDIYNPRLRWNPLFFDVPSSHPAHKAFHERKEWVRGVVQPHLDSAPVKFADVGWHQKACTPCVVILVRRSTELRWAALRREILAGFSEDLEIEVEFIPRWDA